MSSRHFGRQWYAVIGPAGEEGLLIQGLRMQFTVTKTDKREPNKAELRITNTNAETAGRIAQVGNRVFLYAGYRDNGGPKLLAVGDVTRHNVQKPSATERDVTLEFADGATAFRETRTAFSLGAGVPANKALETLAADMGLPLRDLAGVSEVALANGKCGVGYARDMLQSVCETLGAEWSIQNGELQIIPAGGTNGMVAQYLDPESGLIGSPEQLESADGKLDAKKPAPGYKLRAALLPEMEPGGTVIVNSEKVDNATLRVRSVKHTGDSHGAAWNTEMETAAT